MLRALQPLYLEPSGPWRVGVTLVAMVLAILTAIADHVLGAEVSLIALYILPVAGAAWYGARGAGFLVAGSATVGLLATDATTGTLQATPWLSCWDSLVNAVTLGSLAGLAALARGKLRQERRVSRQDPETGALAPAAFNGLVRLEARRAARYQRPLAVLLLGTGGYGSRWELRQCAQALRRHMRVTDRIGRLEGHGLALLLPEAGAAEAQSVAGRVRSLLGEYGVVPRGLRSGILCWEAFSEQGADAGSVDSVIEALDTARSALTDAVADGGAEPAFLHCWRQGTLRRQSVTATPDQPVRPPVLALEDDTAGSY